MDRVRSFRGLAQAPPGASRISTSGRVRKIGKFVICQRVSSVLGVGVVGHYRQQKNTANDERQQADEKKQFHATSLGDARTSCSTSRSSARVQLITATAESHLYAGSVGAESASVWRRWPTR